MLHRPRGTATLQTLPLPVQYKDKAAFVVASVVEGGDDTEVAQPPPAILLLLRLELAHRLWLPARHYKVTASTALASL